MIELSQIEKETIIEVGSIALGASAGALTNLLKQKVTITTPKVRVVEKTEVGKNLPPKCLLVKTRYLSGLQGSHYLLINEEDAAIISSLIMKTYHQDELGQHPEMQISAVAEVMNQMMGLSTISMSELFQRPIRVSPPAVIPCDLTDRDDTFKKMELEEEIVVEISFRIEIAKMLDSTIVQIASLTFAKEMAEFMLSGQAKSITAGERKGEAPDQEEVAAGPEEACPVPEENLVPATASGEGEEQEEEAAVSAPGEDPVEMEEEAALEQETVLPEFASPPLLEENGGHPAEAEKEQSAADAGPEKTGERALLDDQEEGIPEQPVNQVPEPHLRPQEQEEQDSPAVEQKDGREAPEPGPAFTGEQQPQGMEQQAREESAASRQQEDTRPEPVESGRSASGSFSTGTDVPAGQTYTPGEETVPIFFEEEGTIPEGMEVPGPVAGGPADGKGVIEERVVIRPVSSPIPEEKPESEPGFFPGIGDLKEEHLQVEQLELVKDIPVTVTAVFARKKVPLGTLLTMKRGGVIELERYVGEPVEVMVKDKVVARGEVVMVNEYFGVKITSLEDQINRPF